MPLFGPLAAVDCIIWFRSFSLGRKGLRTRLELVSDPRNQGRHDPSRRLTSIVPSSNLARVVLERRKGPNRTGAVPGPHAGP